MIALGLTLVSLVLNGLVAVLDIDDGLLDQMANTFNVVRDRSVPTWFSSLLLLVAALLAFTAHRLTTSEGRRTRWRWAGLAGGLLYMSIDETATIHELLNEPLRETFDVSSGLLYYSWVLVAIPLVVLLAATYWKWLNRLDPDIRRLVIVGGFVFVLGAVGLEMLGAALLDDGAGTASSGLIAHLEEFAEMVGVLLFIEGMIRLLSRQGWVGSIPLLPQSDTTNLGLPNR